MIDKSGRFDRAAAGVREILGPNSASAPAKSGKTGVRLALLAGSALVSALVVGVMFTPTESWAACGGNPTILCTGNDTNGYTTATAADTSITFDSATTGSSTGTIFVTLVGTSGNNDLTVTMANAMSQNVGNSGNGFTILAVNGGGIQNWNIAGTAGATGGNAVSVTLAQGGTVNMTFANTASVFANGTGDLLGVPSSGGGVVLTTTTGAANFSVTNHGGFSTQNDAISLINLLGAGNSTITNDGHIGSSVLAVGGSGAVIFSTNSGANGTVNNDNGQIWATGNGGLTSDFGAVAVTVGGNALVSNTGGTISTVNDAGILAVGGVVAGSGTSTVTSTGGTVTSTNGPGIVAGVLGTGATQIDAGIINSGSDSFSVAGFGTVSGGAIGFSNTGGTTINLHGNVTTSGTYGAFAYSGSGNATTTADAGIVVDPTIGMASVTGGAGIATVANSGTQVTTLIGLVGANIGNGSVTISNTSTGYVNATSGAGILALKVGPGSTPLPSSTNSVAVSNTGTVAAPSGAGVAVFAFDTAGTPVRNDVLISNVGGTPLVNTSITGQGGLLSPAVAAIADGNVTVLNDRGAQITNTTGVSGNGVFVLGGLAVSMTNDRGADSTGTANLASTTAGASLLNDRGGSLTYSGISTVSGATTASLTNDRGGSITTSGNASLNVTGVGGNATLTNDRGGSVTMGDTLGSVNLLSVGAGGDAVINNSRGGTIDMLGGNTVLVVGDNATVNNNGGGQIQLSGLSVVTLTATDVNGVSAINNSANNGFSNDNCGALNGICVNGIATFTGVGSQLQFNNSGGVLSMLNGYNGYGSGVFTPNWGTEQGDLTTINGNFNGTSTSQIGVDARLGGVATSAADLVLVTNVGNTGQVTGSTGIIVNSANNPGQYNPVGIPIVGVTSGMTTFSNFYIDPQSSFYAVKNGEGVIDKGMFFYAHELVPSPNVGGGLVHVLVGLPDTETYQMAYVASGAQNLWYDTALNWIDKQDNLRKRGNDRQIGDGSGFGVWVQGVGAWTKRDASQSVMNSGFNVDTSYHQDTYGILAGVDWTSRSNGNVFQIGVLGGYADSKLTFDASSADNSFHYKGALVGATASFMAGGFFIDGLFKVDLMKMNARMGSLSAFGESSFDTNVTSYGGMANGGYRFDMNSWYVEGLATLAYVKTNIDSKSLQGTGIDWQDGQSLRGAVGARIGTTFDMGGLPTMDVSLLGRVWNEFDGRNKVTLDAGGPSFSVSDGALKNKPFGEIAGLIDLVDIGSGWSGFLNAGVKFNADFTTITAKGGIRYQFGAVAAAPMAPPPAPPPPAATAKKSFIVFFDFDKSNITSQAQTTINDAVAAAKAGNSARVTLTGHTDRSGSEQYNMALSLRRAEAVKANMIKQGIPASAIVVIGKGESQPLVPTADGVREPQNRRVEIVI